LHKIAYNSAHTADRPDVWSYQGVFGDGQFNGTMQNVVAMTTEFWLGTKIQSPTSLFLSFFVYFASFS